MEKNQPFNCPTRIRNARGFTLIEVMVVVAIVGILASVAYPSYMNQIRKSRRAEAVVAVTKIQQAQERWRANCPFYAGSISAAKTGCPTPGGATTSGLAISADSGARYTYELSNVAQSAYTLTATAVSGSSQASDSACTPLTLTVANGNATTDSAQAACWSK